MIVPVMAISNLVLARQIFPEETNGAHAHYREPVPLKLTSQLHSCAVCAPSVHQGIRKFLLSERLYFSNIAAFFHYSEDTVKCDCPVSCNQTKYKAEVSFSKLLDKTISSPVSNWFSNLNGNR